jgi:hypothetical protein
VIESKEMTDDPVLRKRIPHSIRCADGMVKSVVRICEPRGALVVNLRMYGSCKALSVARAILVDLILSLGDATSPRLCWN